MIQLLPEPKMAEDFEKTTININAIYFCGELSDELRKLARERFWNYQDIKINEASEDNFKVTAVHALPDIEVEDDILYREQGYDLEIQEDHAVISYETRIGFINAVTSLKHGMKVRDMFFRCVISQIILLYRYVLLHRHFHGMQDMADLVLTASYGDMRNGSSTLISVWIIRSISLIWLCTDTGHLKWKSILKLFSEMFRSRSGMQKTEGG